MENPDEQTYARPFLSYAEDSAGDAYNVFWMRDIMCATYANEYLGGYDKTMERFKKHHMECVPASIIIKPHRLYQRGLFMPKCVHPTTLETVTVQTFNPHSFR